jgi:DNA repair exonuclease SbcCD ATPase subunit
VNGNKSKTGAATAPAKVNSDERDKAALADLDTQGGASLEKVRDILFGVQMRESDKRFARLEERLAKEITDVKADVKKRLDALEMYIKKEVESIEDRIKTEQNTRTEQDKELLRELKDNAKALEKRIAALDDALARGQKDLRQQMLELHKKLTDEILQKTQEVLTTLARESQELRKEKADRTALASLFTEVAMRLNNEFKLPVTEKNG